jgi:hypothetical protein
MPVMPFVHYGDAHSAFPMVTGPVRWSAHDGPTMTDEFGGVGRLHGQQFVL